MIAGIIPPQTPPIEPMPLTIPAADAVAWGPRTLDIDMISYHDEVHLFRAQIPHPRAASRAFVLRPLADIAPGWRHPEYGTPIGALLASLPAQARVGLKRL